MFKIKLLCALCLVMFFSTTVFARSNYHDYADDERQSVFFDDFSSAGNDWSVGTFGEGCRRSKIENGYFQIESLCDDQFPSFWTNKVEIDENRDFEIEASIKFVTGEDNNSNALFWGQGDVEGVKYNCRYRFGFSGNGQYLIDKYSGSWTNIKGWEKSDLINRNQYNLITIRKVGGQYDYFLNRQWIHQHQFEPFYGKQIGFQSNQNTTIRIDFIRVSYLVRKHRNEPPEIVILSPEISRGIKRLAHKTVRVTGRAVDTDGIFEVKINGVDARLQGDGSFSADVPLAVGKNVISVKATDTRLQSSFKEFTVQRQSSKTRDVAIKTKGKRLALVIGNATYTHGGSLPNPVNDARAMKRALENLGFTVFKYENSSQKDMKKAMDSFGRQLKDYDVGLFFYAGHGVQVNGVNYLIPVDAKLDNENDAEYDTVRADRVMAKMESAGSKTNIVVLDACRDNPFERSWRRGAKGSGLAFMNAPSGSIIAYATSPGETASDGVGNNGLYTSAILEHINSPDITIEEMFKRVRQTIMAWSNDRQVPWESTSLRGNFYFNPQ